MKCVDLCKECDRDDVWTCAGSAIELLYHRLANKPPPLYKISREAREKFWGEIRSRAKRWKILEENKISRAKRAKILGYFDKSTNLKVNPGIQKQLIKSRPRSGRKFWEFKISADFFLQNLKVIKPPPFQKFGFSLKGGGLLASPWYTICRNFCQSW